jgi:hypothetical protein
MLGLFVFQYVMILLNGGVPIAFAGTEEPAAYGELVSIGGLGPDVNGKLSSTIAEILQTKLYIDSSRFYIKFYDAPVNFCFLLFCDSFIYVHMIMRLLILHFDSGEIV